VYEERPWLRFYGDTPHRLEYPEVTLFGAFKAQVAVTPEAAALSCLGRAVSFAELERLVVQISRGFAAEGMRRGDRVLVCLPNIPQAVIAFYALNRLGAVPTMIHPLSASAEIRALAVESSCTWAVVLDAFYPRFAEVLHETSIERIVVCRVADALSPLAAAAFALTKGRRIARVPEGAGIVVWKTLQKRAGADPELDDPDPLAVDDLAVILFSGGTTGAPKAVMLSSRNCNAMALQVREADTGRLGPGDSMLSILPMFHGFGLAVGIHAVLIHGGTCILIPRFTPDTLAKLVRKHRPQYMAGVPTLFDTLAADPVFRATRLSCFKGVFSGADRLSRETKEGFEAVLVRNGCTVPLREGYGLTECVAATTLMPRDHYRHGSVGVPCPDMYVKVVRVGTTDEAEPMEDGEICVSGPTVMIGYLGHTTETAAVLRRHDDGRVWLHTGDLGAMDEDGFLFFRLRMKRIIKTSGVAVYPTTIEEVLHAHPAVRLACVVGVPHPTKIQVPKGFVTLNEGWRGCAELEQQLLEHCRANLSPYSRPRFIEVRDKLPVTAVGKVDYRCLEREGLDEASTPSPVDAVV
jgi:long-chain acyl-CoA synthetase